MARYVGELMLNAQTLSDLLHQPIPHTTHQWVCAYPHPGGGGLDLLEAFTSAT